jgi:hypothetical protein
MHNTDEMKNFIDDKYSVGWYDARNDKLYKCNLYSHFDFFIKNPGLVEGVVEKITSFNEYVSDEENHYASSIEPDEHPAWHVFECWKMDVESEHNKETMFILAENGWYRVGRRQNDLYVSVPKEWSRGTYSKPPVVTKVFDIPKEEKKNIENLSVMMNFNVNYD